MEAAPQYWAMLPLSFVLLLQVRAFEHALRVLSPWFTPELLARLTISSVDGYQGREADVVLFSAVRCVGVCWHTAAISDLREC
jgi:hypothetical protein